MEIFKELAIDFINQRRGHSLVRFEKEISARAKNDILVISYLKRHGGTAHPKDLSEEFMISTAQMAVILNQMEEKSLVVRLHDPQSNRQTIVQLTQTGMEFYDRVNSEIIDFTAGLLHEIGEEDARTLIRILHKLTNAIAAKE